MNSICNFIKENKKNTQFSVLRFVYETQLSKFSQPFIHRSHRITLVTEGSATLTAQEKSYHIKRGSLIITPTNLPYSIKFNGVFNVIYLDFDTNSFDFEKKFNLNNGVSVCDNLESICPVFETAVRNVHEYNADYISEATVLYALSFFLIKNNEKMQVLNKKTSFDNVLDYIKINYNNPNLSLELVSNHFAYSTKYLSLLFKRKLNLGFSKYLTDLRMKKAVEMFNSGAESVADVSYACGYNDQLYFTRVFKKYHNISPTEYCHNSPIFREKNFLKKYS